MKVLLQVNLSLYNYVNLRVKLDFAGLLNMINNESLGGSQNCTFLRIDKNSISGNSDIGV